MKSAILSILLFFSFTRAVNGQSDCYNDGKARIARNNMDEGDDGLTCANAAKFYVLLCQYQTEPLTKEQGARLKRELIAIRTAYNNYGVYCKDIDRINDRIPDSPTITLADENEISTEDILVEAAFNALESSSLGGGGSGDCNYAARNKFGNQSFSSSGAEHAANQYEGYRCHCISGTLQDGFTDPGFDSKPLDTRKALQQIKRLRENYYRVKKPGDPALSPLPSKCANSPRRGSKSAGANPINKAIQDYRTASAIYNNARRRNGRVSQDLANLTRIVNNGNPLEIEQNFNRVMSQIEQIDQELRASINQGYVDGAADIVGQYNSGNTDGALNSTWALAGSISENEEAKEKVKAQRREALNQRNNALRQARKEMINAHNNALGEYIKRAGIVIEEDKEEYYMNKVFFHSASGRYINENFSLNNLAWAKNPYRPVERPSFKAYYNPKYEQHYEAALRKKKLFDEYGNPELLDGAIKHMSAAIDLQPNNAAYYLAMGRIAYPNDMVLSSINYIGAYKLDRGMFDEKLLNEMNSVLADASRDAAQNIRAGNQERVRDYIDAELFNVININQDDMFLYAARVDGAAALEVIYQREISDRGSKKSKQSYLKRAMLVTVENGSANSLHYLLELGLSPDFSLKGKRPIELAATLDKPQIFLMLWKASRSKAANLKRYGGKPVYVRAMAVEFPQDAADGLCRMQQDEQINTAKDLVKMALKLDEAKVAEINKRDKLRLKAIYEQSAFAGGKSDGSAGGNNLQTESSSPISIKGSGNFAYMAPLALCTELKTLCRQNAELKRVLTDAFLDGINTLENDKLAAGLLESGLLAEELLKADAPRISESLIEKDLPQTFRLWRDRALLSQHDVRGYPITFKFIKYGESILKAGLAQGLDFRGRDASNGGLLHNLAFVPSSPNSQYLVQNCGINPNQIGPHGWTPLHFAARENNIDLAKLLLNAGADEDIKDEWGRRPQRVARERDFEEMKKLLKYAR